MLSPSFLGRKKASSQNYQHNFFGEVKGKNSENHQSGVSYLTPMLEYTTACPEQRWKYSLLLTTVQS